MMKQKAKNKPFAELVSEMYWRPSVDTWVALLSYLLVVTGIFLAFQIFTTERVAANFMTFGPLTLALLGVGFPVMYTKRIRKRPLSDVGLTFAGFIPSLLVGVLLSLDTYQNTLATLNLAWTRTLVPLVVMALTVGLFEAVFFRGWLQLRFEAAFGVVPGVILGAACYSLYHVGYGMTLNEMLFLFNLGLFFGAAFRLTKSIFVLWPFYTPIGGLYTNIREGLSLPFEATYGFLITLGLMVLLIIIASRWSLRSEAVEKPALPERQLTSS